ncbi:MAG: PE-PPE domain-containing protein, partial [Mycobacterium sp.]
NAISLTTPELTYSWDQSIAQGVQDLVNAVNTQMADGDVDAANPLWIFGYSQSAVVASMAMQQLAEEGIPTDDLHFVLIGDTASAHGGFLSTFVSSLPESWQSFAVQVLDSLDLGNLIGVTTPDDLYPTDVYTITGDGWADWPQELTLSNLGTAINGQNVEHVEYLGLDPAIIASASEQTDGLVNYFTIPTDNIDVLSTLWNAALAIVGL